MGNCLLFYSSKTSERDDLTRLENFNELNAEPASSFATTPDTVSSSGSGSSNRQRCRRNLQPSSYVNELYVSAAGDEEIVEHKILDEKKQARILSLLEQLNIDHYVKDGKNDDECAICMIDFVLDEPIRYLPCLHSYHVNCIDDWLLRSFTCPSCMEPVDSAILSVFTVNHTGATQNLASLPCSTGRSSMVKRRNNAEK